MNGKTIPTKILIIFIMINLSCSQNKVGWKGSIEEKEGVVTVKNPLDPMYGPEMLSLVEDLSIGDHEEGNNAYFSRISDVKVDKDGCIYILDGMESCLKIFDNHGNYLRT
ncbi:unnamed protein product, partial [marine sediment metagenome]